MELVGKKVDFAFMAEYKTAIQGLPYNYSYWRIRFDLGQAGLKPPKNTGRHGYELFYAITSKK